MEDDFLVSDQQTAPEVAESPQEAPAHESVRDAVRAALDKARSPEGEEARAAADRARDERGRFAGKDPTTAADPAPKPGEQAQTAPEAQAQPEALVMKPPAGWNAAAKAEFARLPPSVQESVAKREQEINRGFAVLADYKGLEEFSPLIKASGTTHAEVMRRAIDWEKSLKTRPVDTVLHVAKIAGVDLARIVAMQQGQRGNQTPQQFRPQQQAQPALDPRQVETLVQRTIAEREATSVVERFLADPANVHAEAVADHMAALINSGQAKDLQDAYDRACWSNPEIRATLVNQPGAQSRTRQVADQARRAGRAITGAPSGRQPTSQQAQPNSVMDAIKAAVAQQRDA